jgi:hypothetical protein
MKINVPPEVQRLWDAIDSAQLDKRIDRLTRRLEALSLPLAPSPSPCTGCRAACPGKSECIWHQAGRRPNIF